MVDHGSQIRRYKDSRDSAWEIVNLIREKKEKKDLPIQIQKELVDLQKRIPQTKAGDALRNSLKTLLEEQKAALRRMKQSPDSPEEYEEAEKQLRSTLEQIQDLKIPLGQRILAVFFP